MSVGDGPFMETEVLGSGEAQDLEAKIRIFEGPVNFGLTAFISDPVERIGRWICEPGQSGNDRGKR